VSVMIYISKLASILLFLVWLIHVVENTIIGKFLTWLRLDFLFGLVNPYFNVIVAFLGVLVVLKWIKDLRILAVVGLLIYLFMRTIT